MATHVATNQDPADGATQVSRATNINFTAPEEFNDDLITVTFQYDGGSAIPVITSGVFQSGYAGSITPDGDDLAVVINPTARLPGSTDVTVNASTPDNAYTNSHGWYQGTTGVSVTTRFINFDNCDACTGQTACTSSIWAYFDSDTVSQVFFFLSSSSTTTGLLSYWRASFNTNNAIIVTVGDGTDTHTWTSGNNAFPADAWHHLVVRWDGSDVDVFVDNVELTPVSASGTHPATIGTASRMHIHQGINGPHTRFDEFACWNYALSDDEITDLYNTGETHNLMDGSNRFEDPILYAPLNNDYAQTGAGSTSDGTAAGSGSDYGFTTSVVAGQDENNLLDDWTFTTRAKPSGQVFLITD